MEVVDGDPLRSLLVQQWLLSDKTHCLYSDWTSLEAHVYLVYSVYEEMLIYLSRCCVLHSISVFTYAQVLWSADL